jgi:hypothetical protein
MQPAALQRACPADRLQCARVLAQAKFEMRGEHFAARKKPKPAEGASKKTTQLR